jgi:hypothetical protein
MLNSSFVAVAIVLRFAAGLSYLRATWQGIVRPSPVTWLLWALTPLIAFVAQIQGGINPQAWMTLSVCVGPTSIFLAALGRRTRWRVGPFDVLCGVCAAIGIVLWQVTDDPVLAIVFSITADALGGIPTIIKAYHAPSSEKIFPYGITIVAFLIILLTVRVWNFINCAFFCYGVFINLAVCGVVRGRSVQLGRLEQGQAGRPEPSRLRATSTASLGSAPHPSRYPLPAAVTSEQAISDHMRIDLLVESLQATVAVLEHLVTVGTVPRQRLPEHPVTAGMTRDRWEGWEGSA